MGCSSSKENAAQMDGHCWTVTQMQQLPSGKSPDLRPASSWENLYDKEGGMVQPQRILHERHLRKLNKFLKKVEADPEAFKEKMKSDRSSEVSQDTTGTPSKESQDESEFIQVEL
mmetsp:Transcript_18833/g.35317  ORF Transcript_18833/g.35317 Transcript_18833/m.35317 type:complete len:115 (+) Transcript_18833:50-394(+)